MKKVDIVFIEYPTVVEREPFSLGFRYMVSYLRNKGISAEVVLPPKMMFTSENRGQWGDMLRSLSSIFCSGYKKKNNHFYEHIAQGILRQIQEMKPVVIGFSPYDKFFVPILDHIKFLRANGVDSHVTIGGHYATFAGEEILKRVGEIDSVVCGEGERTIYELYERIIRKAGLRGVPGLIYRENGRVNINRSRDLIGDLDTLPSPDPNIFLRYLNKRERYIFSPSISSSRGCYSKCSFCTISEFYKRGAGKKWRTVSPSKFVGEVKGLNEKYGFRTFNIIDDGFIGPGKIGLRRIKAIAKEMKRNKLCISFAINARVCDIDEKKIKILKRIGLNSVFLGIESMSQDCLDRFEKKQRIKDGLKAISLLDKHGLMSYFGFIFFDPLMCVKDVENNLKIIDIIRKKKGEEYFFPYYPLFPLIGTPIFGSLKAKKLLEGDFIKGFTFKFVDKRVKLIYDLVRPLYGNFEFIRFLCYLIHGFPFNIVGIDERLREQNCGKANASIRQLLDIDRYLLLDHTPRVIKNAIKSQSSQRTVHIVQKAKKQALSIFLDYLTDI